MPSTPKTPWKQLPKAEQNRLLQLTVLEDRIRAKGLQRIAGVDEAGRGPLAGPVVAAACMIAPGLFFEGIDDSKRLSPKKRRALFDEITAHPQVTWAYSVVSAQVIDTINVLQAARLAMKEAVEKLVPLPEALLIDALILDVQELYQEKIIKGDRLSQSIAAASVIAKTIRDELMCDLHNTYPLYGFDRHKGYGTRAHLDALTAHGPCPAHRRSFAPVTRLLFV